MISNGSASDWLMGYLPPSDWSLPRVNLSLRGVSDTGSVSMSHSCAGISPPTPQNLSFLFVFPVIAL